jgi:hypothetical protein
MSWYSLQDASLAADDKKGVLVRSTNDNPLLKKSSGYRSVLHCA